MKLVPGKSYLCVKCRGCSHLTAFDDSGEPLPSMSPAEVEEFRIELDCEGCRTPGSWNGSEIVQVNVRIRPPSDGD
jgi:hypothetical protein